MVMDAVVERCVEQSPVTVMARLALPRALEPAWIDELFERAGGTQYTRELLFSNTVELMSVVAVGLRPSIRIRGRPCWPSAWRSSRITPWRYCSVRSGVRMNYTPVTSSCLRTTSLTKSRPTMPA